MECEIDIFNKIEKDIETTLKGFGCSNIKINITKFQTSINNAFVLVVSWFTSFGDYESKRLTYYDLDDLKNYEEDLF